MGGEQVGCSICTRLDKHVTVWLIQNGGQSYCRVGFAAARALQAACFHHLAGEVNGRSCKDVLLHRPVAVSFLSIRATKCSKDHCVGWRSQHCCCQALLYVRNICFK